MILTTMVSFVSAGQGVTSIGVKQHAKHSVYTDLPYDDGDLSACLAYGIQETDSFWQLALDYSFDVNGIESTSFVLTPQLNMLWTDGPWYGGVGILDSYIDDDVAGADWTGIYWQAILGARIPFFGVKIDLATYYPFESWGDINDFDFQDLNYGAWLNLSL